MGTGKVVRESLDRLSIIIMGGVAAEANKYNKTEGGLDDERQMIDFFDGFERFFLIFRTSQFQASKHPRWDGGIRGAFESAASAFGGRWAYE